jgi:hypothetical protein
MCLKKQSVEASQDLISDAEFKNRHRKSVKVFVRTRKLPFGRLIVLILQKGLKSLQLRINELTSLLGGETLTNSALTQARANLKHTAFIELNRKAVVDVMYGDDDYKRYKDMRVLGIDGSKILLPSTPDIINAFGQISYSNDQDGVEGQHAYGLASALYDVLNHVAVDSFLGKAKDYEVNLAIQHLDWTRENDLLICDRNYPSYYFLSYLSKIKRHFVIRCSASSFQEARDMLTGEGAESRLTMIACPPQKRALIQSQALPESITVRFVRVQLETGEYEVLVTSLLDDSVFPTTDFLGLYHLRWGVEGFYGILKTRLHLENFSGKTAESIYQDFYSTVYLSGLESILTADTNERLSQKMTQHPQQVNHAVSFNAIKNQAFNLLLSNQPSETVIAGLEKLFLTNPVSKRVDRKVPRQKRSARHLINFLKRNIKICF